MKTIYCISGLGADEKAFSRLDITGHKLVSLPWLVPLKSETIQGYARRMVEKVEDKNPVLMGLSFGGMMCIEMARHMKTDKVILISSIKSATELPLWMRYSGKLKLNRILPMKSYSLFEPIQNIVLGVKDKAEKAMVRKYRREAPQAYVDWAINEVLNWRNTWQPPSLFHIHGDHDRTFPIRYIKPTHLVKGGGHFMIMNKASEISRYINTIV